MKVLQFKNQEERYVDLMGDILKKVFGKIDENGDEFVSLANTLIEDEETQPVYVFIHGLERADIEKYRPEYTMLAETKSILMVQLNYNTNDNKDNQKLYSFQCMNPLKDICELEDLDFFMIKLLCSMIHDSVNHKETLKILLRCYDYKKYLISAMHVTMVLNIFSDELIKTQFLKIQYVETMEEKIKFFDLGIKEALKKYEE